MKRNTVLVGVLVATTAVVGCKKKEEPKPAEPPAGSGTAAEPGPAADAGAAAPASGALKITGGLSTPESVLHDEAQDRYLVSNIKGAPTDADDNGYIAVVTPEGAISTWIDGAKDEVKLDAPKGMAISGDVLWVADITKVRRFDARTGAQQPDVEIAGAAFLNDVTPDGAGGVFVSDSGLDPKFQPTGADAIYHVASDGKVTPRIKAKDLGNPNGIAAGPDGALWVVTFGTNELYAVDAKGAKAPPAKLPKGQLDGVVVLDGGELLVSSWEGKAVYRGKPDGAWTEQVTGIESPADIGFDRKRKRLLIPGFMTNTVTAHPVE